jgi:hypothetical protein
MRECGSVHMPTIFSKLTHLESLNERENVAFDRKEHLCLLASLERIADDLDNALIHIAPQVVNVTLGSEVARRSQNVRLDDEESD